MQYRYVSGKMSRSVIREGIKVRYITRYSEDFKQVVINKLLSSDSPSMRSVAKEYDIPIATLASWLQKIEVGTMINENGEKPTSSSTKMWAQCSRCNCLA